MKGGHGPLEIQKHRVLPRPQWSNIEYDRTSAQSVLYKGKLAQQQQTQVLKEMKQDQNKGNSYEKRRYTENKCNDLSP